MSNIDFTEVAALLAIVEKCAGHSGKLGSLSNAAMAELLTLNGNIQEEAKRAAAAAKADQEEVDNKDTSNANLNGQDPNLPPPSVKPSNGRRV